MSTNESTSQQSTPLPTGRTSLAAVIEIGSSSLRMMIAQVGDNDEITVVDNLTQAISLGQDVFSMGRIRRSTIEDCVKGIKQFRQILKEYQLDFNHDVRTIATSAVREASNSQLFVDRIYMATHLNVEVIDEAGTNRFTYHVIEPYIAKKPFTKHSEIVAVEVGGGSTDVLVIKDLHVIFSNEYRLGSLRLQQRLPDPTSINEQGMELLDNDIKRTVLQIKEELHKLKKPSLLLLGGDIRLAASRICKKWHDDKVVKMSVKALTQFCNEAASMSLEKRVNAYSISFPDAETLVPSLLTYVRLAEEFELQHVYTIDATAREGILKEVVFREACSETYMEQVYYSALEIAAKYSSDTKHCQHVCDVSEYLFDVMKPEHGLPNGYKMLLTVAALLHDIGLFVSPRSHHKHSRYLILNSDIFGLGAHDQLLAALIARYHRKSHPGMQHSYYKQLPRQDRSIVSKLSAILRIADAMDRGHNAVITDYDMTLDARELLIRVRDMPDISIHVAALSEKGKLFEEVYGLDVRMIKDGVKKR